MAHDTGRDAVADEVRVQEAAIDAALLLSSVRDPAAGAVVLFLGTVRDHSAGRPGVTHLEFWFYSLVTTLVKERKIEIHIDT